MERLNRLKTMKAAGRPALVTFITAGDPDPAATVPLMHALVAAGADVLEIGVPFSDPMADGPAIQRANDRALRHGVRLQDVLRMVAEFRRRDDATPVVLMGYANPIEVMGWTAFARAARASGVDGVLTVDYPPEQAPEYLAALAEAGLAPVLMVSPTTRPERMAAIARAAGGFLYYVSLKGVTGADSLDLEAVRGKIGGIRRETALPVAVGFGIRSAAQAGAVSAAADAVVVGSRIIEELECTGAQGALSGVEALVRDMKLGLTGAKGERHATA